ncbi:MULTISPECIES: NAD-dependent epimerase/dehydratase family protein [unclassified Carboxylicivirga]|uniref:NAD-dependent epimerase/dehydratase family protein n=1 Tax=Carboxylicivirga TaxID=1628153 RepID=UPI003D34F44E
MKSVFVTGINGLLGTNLVNFLLKSGFKVFGLVRHINSYQGMQSEHLKIIRGTLFDDHTTVLSKVDYVIHIAAVTAQNILSETYYWRVNTNATKQLYQNAIKCNVKKFVFVSSANTIGYGSKEKPGSEEMSWRQPFCDSIYAQSKKLAENHVLSGKCRMKTIVVNPTFMLGAFDTKPSSGKIVLMAWKKKMVFYPPGGKNFVHVEDVAKGILYALQKGRNRNRYLLSNENLSYYEFFQKLNRVCQQKPVMVKVPKVILLALGHLGDFLRRANVATSLSSVNMRTLCINNYYTNHKSASELDLSYQPVDKAIEDAISYFEHGVST